MDLKQLFEKANVKTFRVNGLADADCLVGCVTLLHDMQVVDGEFTMAILGITDGLNAFDNNGCADSPDRIRDYLWGLKIHDPKLKILDLGNVLGSTVKDKYWAVKETIGALCHVDIPILVLGGSQDFSIPIINGIRANGSEVNVSVIDAFVDHVGDFDDLSSNNFIGNLMTDDNLIVGQLSFLGLQKYFLGDVAENLLDRVNVDHLRLGDLRGEAIRDAEPLLRESHFVSFDAMAMRNAEMPGQSVPMPNGFAANEVCQLARYVGASDSNKAFGLFEINIHNDLSDVSAFLAAQMSWFYIDGILARTGDYPKREISSYPTYNIDKDEYGMGIKFYNNPINGRWWVEIETENGPVLKPCSEKDYRLAVANEIPDKFWKRAVRN